MRKMEWGFFHTGPLLRDTPIYYVHLLSEHPMGSIKLVRPLGRRLQARMHGIIRVAAEGTHVAWTRVTSRVCQYDPEFPEYHG